MAARVAEYEALLQDLGDRVCEADLAVIRRVLNKVMHAPVDRDSPLTVWGITRKCIPAVMIHRPQAVRNNDVWLVVRENKTW